jgi:hypothetical protein
VFAMRKRRERKRGRTRGEEREVFVVPSSDFILSTDCLSFFRLSAPHSMRTCREISATRSIVPYTTDHHREKKMKEEETR